jgi:hypothetical protein
VRAVAVLFGLVIIGPVTLCVASDRLIVGDSAGWFADNCKGTIKLVADTDGERDSWDGVLGWYCAGFLKGVRETTEYGNTDVIKNTPLSTILPITLQWIERHPESRNWPAVAAITIALLEKYPPAKRPAKR